MAKKKTPPPEPPVSSERVTVVNLKGSPEFRDWLGGISGKTLIPASSIVRTALVEWAEKNGHEKPPRR